MYVEEPTAFVIRLGKDRKNGQILKSYKFGSTAMMKIYKVKLIYYEVELIYVNDRLKPKFC